jgi:transcriptional regulator with XRE-family HTH domain
MTVTSREIQDAKGRMDWFNAKLTKLKRDPEYVAEALALDIVEQVLLHMEEQGITRSQLAERMKVSRPYITQVFDTPPNMTLETVARVALAVGTTPVVSLNPIAASTAVRVTPEIDSSWWSRLPEVADSVPNSGLSRPKKGITEGERNTSAPGHETSRPGTGVVVAA